MSPEPEIPSCGLDGRGLSAQQQRYAMISRTVVESSRSLRLLTATLSSEVDLALVESTLAVERECCPFFELDFDPGSRRLVIAVESEEMAPAIDAIAYALGVGGQPRP